MSDECGNCALEADHFGPCAWANECICWDCHPESYEGPLSDCPLHGEQADPGTPDHEGTEHMPEPRAGTTCTCPPPAAGGIVGVNRGHLLGCPALRARSTTRTTVAEPPIPDGLRMAAYRAAREWATAHHHQQPDDRMVDAVLAAVYPLLRAQIAEEVRAEAQKVQAVIDDPATDPATMSALIDEVEGMWTAIQLVEGSAAEAERGAVSEWALWAARQAARHEQESA